MDEYNSGMEPEVKKYFRKIMNSFFMGLLWLLTVVTAGLYFRLGLPEEGLHWYNILFYAAFLASFFLLLRYFYKTWK